MGQNRWIDQSHPQTLQIGCWLLYINAFFGLIGGAVSLPLLLGAVAAFFIANEKRWAYYLGIAVAVLSFLRIFRLWVDIGFNLRLAISVMFAGALVGLLLHPDSRNHQRIWFK